MASPTGPTAAPIGHARIALGLALILVAALGQTATSATLKAAPLHQTALAFRGQNVGVVGPIVPIVAIVAPDGAVYVWTTAPGVGGTIVALDSTGKTRSGWPVVVGGGSPQVLTPDGTLMTMECADLGPCRLGALNADGREREGWG